MAGFCILVLASPMHDKSYLASLGYAVEAAASSLGSPARVEAVATSEAEAAAAAARCDAVLAVAATGGTERLILAAASTGKPMVVLALPYANSLPAVLEAAPLLERGAIVYSGSLDPHVLAEALREPLRALEAVSSLHGSRLGVVGKPSPWLVYSLVRPEDARGRLGVELVEIPIDRLYEEMDRSEPPRGLAEKLASSASRVEVPEENIVEALRVYVALKRIVERYRLNAVTVECFRLLGDRGTTACLALSLLNSEGVVAGCEADVPAALTMMLLHAVSRKPVFMGNPAALDKDGLVLAHCTAPIAAGRSYSLYTHFESGRGVGVSVEYPRDTTVTVARFSPDLRVLRAFPARIMESGLLSRLHCRTQLRLQVGFDPKLILERSLGNHYALALGDHVEALRYAAAILGARLDTLQQ